MEEDKYHVKYLMGARAQVDNDNNLKWEYLVKWTEYDEEEAIWEPCRNFRMECHLLESFWSMPHHQERASMYLYVVASQEWIDAEKAWYWSQI
ncbi:hypothetical protein EV421DRAFT_1905438 [Armillaria borealis]|uniref:Chromo domain-containing protein n=1 Tax=Armillaria borealis TaxID=47425 RepID=A0AA39JDY9_9AGAR|nr:hypothetical protein EV421DRAFT_1905438 [Armillaria borealis]